MLYLITLSYTHCKKEVFIQYLLLSQYTPDVKICYNTLTCRCEKNNTFMMTNLTSFTLTIIFLKKKTTISTFLFLEQILILSKLHKM